MMESVMELQNPCKKEAYEVFAQELVKHGNALAAYKVAYPDCKPDSARANAYRLKKVPDVARRVAFLLKVQREQLLKDTEDLEVLVGNLALGKAAELIDEDGKPVPIQELPAHVKAAIAGLDIELDEDGRVSKYKIKFPDPLQAMRLLAQLRGQLIERKDVTSGGRALEPIIDPSAVPAEDLALIHKRLGIDVVEGDFEELDDDDVSDLL